MNYYDIDDSSILELNKLKNKTIQLEEFIDTRILPVKEAFRCIGLESLDYDVLSSLLRTIEQDHQKCMNLFYQVKPGALSPGWLQWRDNFIHTYYNKHPDVLGRLNILKEILETIEQHYVVNCDAGQRQILQSLDNIHQLFPSTFPPFLNVDINGKRCYDLTKPGLVASPDEIVQKLASFQNTYYRYTQPSSYEFKFSRLDDRLWQIRTQNNIILQAYRQTDLNQSIEVLEREQENIMYELEKYLNI